MNIGVGPVGANPCVCPFNFVTKCRHMIKTSHILLFLLFARWLPLHAQETFSLQDLVRITLEENYQLQIVRNRQQMAENMHTTGNAGMLPSVGISSERNWDIQTTEVNLYTGVTRTGENALNTGFNAMVALDWTLFDGFSMFARRDRLGHLAALGALDTRYYVEQTITDLSRAYYHLVREQQLFDAYRQLQEVSTFRLELEQQKLRLGSGNALQVHQALIDFHADSAMLVDQQTTMRDLQIQINRLINRDPRKTLTPSEKTFALQGIDPDEELIRLSITNNQDVERARLLEMLAEADHRIERGYRYPHLSVFGAYGLTRQTSETGLVESAQSRGPRIGVRVRFNLYDGGRQTTQIRNALLEMESTGYNIQDTQATLEADIIRLTQRYDSYRLQYNLLRQSQDAAARSISIAREQLQAGAINGVEFRHTQLAALQVDNQLILLLHAMRLVEIDLYRISGQLTDRLL